MKSLATFIALNRFGLGPAPGEADKASKDPRGWIKAQIETKRKPVAAFEGLRSVASMNADIHNARLKSPEDLKKTTGGLYRAVFRKEQVLRARHMIGAKQPFAERMVLFWSNHFTVSLTKRIIGPTIPAYEREAIRPHIFGRFEDMLKAVCTHPTMVAYLDNIISMGPNSTAGKRRIAATGTKKTINENLAREILELHTLGVNGGYTQIDVIELAKAITGWSHGGLRMRQAGDTRPVHGGFEFNPAFHEPGVKTVLGKVYKENGVNTGLAILADLARHPSTANFIATKLVRHFVADDPPAAAVNKIAAVFRKTDGDLAAVSTALVDLDDVWASPMPKVKNHYELVISALRATGNVKADPRDIMQPLRELGHIPFTASSPKGWGDSAKDWIAPEALMRRIEWLRRYSATLPSNLFPAKLLEDTIGPVASDETRTWVSRAPSGDAAIAMVLGSPEFQRR